MVSSISAGRLPWPPASEREAELGRLPRRMSLAAAAADQRNNVAGVYVLLRQGRPLYTGQSTNLRLRMTTHQQHIRRYGVDPGEYSVRLTHTPRVTAAQRLALEQRLSRAVQRAARMQNRRLPTNIQGGPRAPQPAARRESFALSARSYAEARRRFQREHPERTAAGVARFVVRTGLIPEGHERLTREAAAGVPGIAAAEMQALIEGVRRPDTESLRNHILPGQQRRHALRARLCQPLAEALRDARGQFAELHRRALTAPTRLDIYRWAGEALHLLQDSYAPAHMQRVRAPDGRFPITYIRVFGVTGQGAPREHGFPFDGRDLVADVGGGLRPWSHIAIDASRQYLQILKRHLAAPRGPSVAAELRAFMDRQFVLSPRRTEPRDLYLRCRL